MISSVGNRQHLRSGMGDILYLPLKADTPEQTAFWWDQKLQLEQQKELLDRTIQDINRILGILAVEEGLEG